MAISLRWDLSRGSFQHRGIRAGTAARGAVLDQRQVASSRRVPGAHEVAQEAAPTSTEPCCAARVAVGIVSGPIPTRPIPATAPPSEQTLFALDKDSSLTRSC